MIELKSAEEVGKMAVAGQFVGELLTELKGVADVGVNLMDIEHHARRRIDERGAVSCYWDYSPSFGRGPFRNVLCLSVNDAVLHGLPHDYVLADGDLVPQLKCLAQDAGIAGYSKLRKADLIHKLSAQASASNDGRTASHKRS